MCIRDRPFLVSLPAGVLYDTPAKDEVLVQGAMDLLALKDGECVVVDYKYSGKDAAQLLADVYKRQL